MQNDQEKNQAKAMREQALALLKSAQEIDGLIPQVILHHHRFGATAYIGHFYERPGDDVAKAILEEEFDEDRGESMDVADITLEELAGLDEARIVRAPDPKKLKM